jgi:hypothetical protein
MLQVPISALSLRYQEGYRLLNGKLSPLHQVSYSLFIYLKPSPVPSHQSAFPLQRFAL